MRPLSPQGWVNKMTKRYIILGAVLAVLLVAFAFCALNVDAAEETSGSCGENLTWRYDSATKTLYIDGYGAMEEYFIGFPWDGLTIENIVLPEGLTTIADSAFENSSVRNIVIPDSVTVIGSDAFNGCHRLTTVEIGSGVTEIGGEAFRGCSMLESVVIPGNVKTIHSFAFGSCAMLKSVTVCDGVELIDDYAFNRCFRLEYAYIGNQVTVIGQKAFEACALNNILIPESVTTFNMDAFKDCKTLETVTVESVEVIKLILKENDGQLPWGIKSLILDEKALRQVPCVNTDTVGVTTISGDKTSYGFDSVVWAQAASHHRYSTDYTIDSQFHWSECPGCGRSSGNVPHSYELEVITPATYEASGKGKYFCECGFHYFDIIPVLVPEESEEDFEHVIISPQPTPDTGDSGAEAQSNPIVLLIIIGAVLGALGAVLVNVAIIIVIIIVVKKKKKNKNK